MIPKSVSKAAQAPAAVSLRRRLDEQRRLLGGSRREVLAGLFIPAKGRHYTELAFTMVKAIRLKRRTR